LSPANASGLFFFPRGIVLRKLPFLLAVSAAALFLPVAAHAYCYGVPQPPTGSSGHVCGSVNRFGYNGSQNVWKSGIKTYVKLCPQGSTSGCSTVTSTQQLDGWGQTIQAFTFPYFRQGATGYQTFDLYLWSATSANPYWGSSSKPQGWISIGPYGIEGLSYAMVPRPLEPTPVYPSGSMVPSSYTVRWKSGKDIDRQPYPTTYQLWFKYWPLGGTEPASWSQSVAGMACHANGSGPDANNECSTNVTDMLPGNWKWYMVADANLSSVVSYNDGIYSTQSSSVAFVQPN
jgi:hypothetical protein